jgi:DNA-binding CsgD family transcriptional regulator
MEPTSPLSATEPPGRPSPPELSEREMEVLRLVATGVGNKEIAQQLFISPNTVKVHLRNIFAKIGVTSRTEAAMYALQTGLVQMPNASQGDEAPAVDTITPEINALPPAPQRPPWVYAGLALSLFALVMLAVMSLWPKASPQPLASPPAISTPTALPRWQSKAPLLTARSGLAATTYANQIFAIGGETGAGVTDAVEQYDPVTDAWRSLAPKPSAVTDVQAAVIGGKIYVPGGREASGKIVSVLEAYDPRTDRWERRASLPTALSAYALVAFEGNLYVFGGWGGDNYLASVYKYDPSTDTWVQLTAMPTARGFLGAAVAAGKIYVIGGTDGTQALTTTEVYIPSEESAADAWQTGTPLPQGRSKMGVTSIADIIHVIGGNGPAGPLTSLKYFPQKNEWQAFETPTTLPWAGLELATANTYLYAFGGLRASQPMTQTWAYEAIYTISIPVFTR